MGGILGYEFGRDWLVMAEVQRVEVGEVGFGGGNDGMWSLP